MPHCWQQIFYIQHRFGRRGDLFLNNDFTREIIWNAHPTADVVTWIKSPRTCLPERSIVNSFWISSDIVKESNWHIQVNVYNVEEIAQGLNRAIEFYNSPWKSRPRLTRWLMGHITCKCNGLFPTDTVVMTSSNGSIFRVTGPLGGEFTGHRWIPLTKASDAELRCFLSSAPEQTVK